VTLIAGITTPGGSRRRPTEYGRQAAQINVSANAAAAAGTNGKPPTVFEAMVMVDLDFVKLSAHPEYSTQQPFPDGVPPELAPPLRKYGEPNGYVISESLVAIDRRILEQTGRTEDGPLQNLALVRVSDVEFLALCGHPLYEHHFDPESLDKHLQGVRPELTAKLTRKDKNIIIISQSEAAANLQRQARIRAKTEKLLQATAINAGNGQPAAELPKE
jgi:hypothetical protein